MLTRRDATLLAFIVFTAEVASAQQISPGQRISVSTRESMFPVRGNLLEFRVDSVVVEATRSGRPARVGVARSDVTALKISIGRRTHVRRGATIGLAIGAVVGAAVIASDPYWGYGPTVYTIGGAAGGTFGSLVGAIIGAAPTESWRPIPVDALHRDRK